MAIDLKKRVYANKAKSGSVILAGWAQDIQVLRKLAFITLRDASGNAFLVIKSDLKNFKELSNLNRESVISIKGKVQKSKSKKFDKEILVQELEILNKAHPLPIEFSGKIDTNLDKRLDWRFIDLRNPKINAIFKIQAEISQSFREFFIKEGFTEFWPPEIIEAAPEGGADLFSVDYFGDKVYLAQSPELYKEMCTGTNLEKVFCIIPIWRAEKHNTVKHLNEIRQMDIEAAFKDQHSIIDYLDRCVKYIVKDVLKNCKEEIKLLNPKLKIPQTKKLSYKEIIDSLNKHKFKIKYGEDLSPEAEKKIDEIYGENTLVFIHSWPTSQKPFYIMTKDGKISEGFDADYGGIEIASGGQRIHDPELLKERLKVKDLNVKDFKFFIDSLKYGIPPHAGWSIGLERLTMIICGLKNIREACLFPRDRNRLLP
jgi:aspartyl-tRNA synthetase